jgi:hypothetical protein
MILADTSIWIEMFRKGRFKARIGELIARDRLCIHPFVIAELACGTLPQRQKTLANLDELTALPVVNLTEVRFMIEARGLWAKGIGFTDLHLIASCLATPGTQIWTIDGPLGRVAESLGIRAQLP